MLNVDVTKEVSTLALEQATPFTVELEAAPVDELIAERDAAAAKLKRLSVFDDNINDAEQRRQAANAALRQFFHDEKAKLLAWAESAGAEAAPTRDMEEYAKLVAAVDDAERQHSAAVAMRDTAEPNFARVRAVLHDVQIRLDSRTAQAIAEDVLRECAEINALLDGALTKHARVIAARDALYRRAQALHADRQPQRAGAWGSAAGRLVDMANKLVIAPSPSDTSRHFDYWNSRINGEDRS